MALKDTIEWNPTPPEGLGFQTHKFSLLDVIEVASMRLGTDYTSQKEDIITGQKGRVVLSTLPQVVLETTEDGLLKRLDDGKALLGKVGNRRILFDKSKAMFDAITVTNGTDEARIVIPESKHVVNGF